MLIPELILLNFFSTWYYLKNLTTFKGSSHGNMLQNLLIWSGTILTSSRLRVFPCTTIFLPSDKIHPFLWFSDRIILRILSGHDWLMKRKTGLKASYFRILAYRIKKIEKKFINEFDAIVPISSSDLTWFKAEGLSRPSLITVPGYNPEEICEYSETVSDNVFFIGALDWLPNISGLKWFIKEVWPIVADRIPGAEFFIAGRNASGKTISGLKGHNIIFVGEVDSSY